MGSTIDLHVHTNASDGTDSPEQLLANVQKAGIKIFAVTDHDTINGAMEMKKIVPSGSGSESGIKFIQGIEFSCRTQKSRCHILGINYDENNQAFQDALNAVEELRHQKFFVRIKFLRENFGIEFTDEEIDYLSKIPGIGKPLIANMIVSKGFAENRQDAISRYLNKLSTSSYRIEAGRAVKAVNSSGGIPVWAHPLGGEGERELTEREFFETLEELISYGLKGLECWYSKYPVTKCEWLVSIAQRSGLLVSGGSDYHGKNKSIPLGRLNSDEKIIDVENLSVLTQAQEG